MIFRAIASSALLFALPGAALAQSVAPGPFGAAGERRVSVGVTLPFGPAARPSERAPRLELGVDSRNANARDALLVLPVEEQFRRTRIGVTLHPSPQLMLNGREVLMAERRHNLSTEAWIGIGLVVVAAAAVAVYAKADAASQ